MTEELHYPDQMSPWREAELRAAPYRFREPTINHWYPEWWSEKGAKMGLDVDKSNTGERVVINANAAAVAITHSKEGYEVSWEIQHAPDISTVGKVLFDQQTLEGAFGLSDYHDPNGDLMLQMFGGTAASEGKFIRYGDFLNIPGPRVNGGKSGEFNVSIELMPNVQQAVKDLISARAQ